MACKMIRSLLLMCVIVHLMQSVYLVYCPRYLKYEAIEQGRLSDRAACRAMQYDYDDTICLDGYQHSGFYCATGGCNIFGYACDGHCLTGDDSTNRDENNFSSKCSNVTALSELDNLCQVYNEQLTLRRNGQTDKDGGWTFINPVHTIQKVIIEHIEHTIKNVCTVTIKN